MSHLRMSFAVLLVPLVPLLVACGHSPTPSPAKPSEHALSGLAAQHVVILPTYSVRVAPGFGWKVPRPADVARTQDADIAASFDEHSIRTWILPSRLDSAYRRNPTYATDPHTLAEEPLRSPTLGGDQRLPEPIATQLRTIVALHDDTRLVLAPVELRFEAADAGAGRGVLRLVLIDARASSVLWVGEITSDPAPSLGPAITASIASKLTAVVTP
jgi:hypothetical protein